MNKKVNQKYISGYVGVIGKTNAGKSTLVNTLVGEKVAIVSSKTQTTRNNILGILTSENYQLIFVDTPGIHKSQNNLDRKMNKNVRNAVSAVDIIIYLVDSSKKSYQDDLEYVKKLNTPIIVVLSKVDKVKKSSLFNMISSFANVANIKDIIPISVFKNININVLLDCILKLLPTSSEKNFAFSEDMYTDRSTKFLIAEIIREKALINLQDEIPHGVAVDIKTFEEKKRHIYILADIICEKESHKNIIIGKQGSMIKKISISAREEIEKLLQRKVMLETWVRVKKNWRQLEQIDFGEDLN